VPIEPSLLIKDQDGRSWCKASCRFLALSIRGNVPERATVPGQIIDGGTEGVMKMIEGMFPDALKTVCHTKDAAPTGWQHLPRAPKTDAPAAAPEETPDSAGSGTTGTVDSNGAPGTGSRRQAVGGTAVTARKARSRRAEKDNVRQ